MNVRSHTFKFIPPSSTDSLKVPNPCTTCHKDKTTKWAADALKTWPEFCVIKSIADYAEILQVEDLLHCSFHPLRDLARITMPEEKFHAKFGKDFCMELIRTAEGKAAVQDAINRYFPITPGFFGASKSKNNEMYLRWGLKSRSNDEMREDFLARVTELVEKDFGLTLPKL